MKLAYLLKKFPRLSETFVLNEILGQESLGAEISIFSRRKPDDEPAHPQLARLIASVEVLPNVKEINPWKEVFPGGAVCSELVDRIGKAMADLDGIEIPRFPSLLAEAIYLRRRCEELGIEHVHVHFATDSAVTAMLLHDLGGPTYSVTAHAKDIYRSTVDPRLLSRLLASSAFTVTVCDANVNWLADCVTPEAMGHVRRLYNGIDLSAFEPDTNERPSAKILSVGRLVEKKGLHVLIAALRILRDEGVSFDATIAGDGDRREALEQQIEEEGLSDRIVMTGAVDQAAIRKHMSESTLFALPCIIGEDGNRDALPTVLLEAQAVGLPVVSTPVTGIPEILGGGETGLIVPENDAVATAAAIRQLLEDAELRARLAERGIERTRELFDAKTNARILNGWFGEVLAGASI